MPETPKRMTVIEIEEWIRDAAPPGCKREQIYHHIRKAGLRLDKQHRVDSQKFLEAYLRHKSEDNKLKSSGALDDPKRRKAILEGDVLEVKLQQMRGELVARDEMNAGFREMAAWVRDAVGQWIMDAKVLTGDARVVADAERLRDQLFERMRQKCEG